MPVTVNASNQGPLNPDDFSRLVDLNAAKRLISREEAPLRATFRDHLIQLMRAAHQDVGDLYIVRIPNGRMRFAYAWSLANGSPPPGAHMVPPGTPWVKGGWCTTHRIAQRVVPAKTIHRLSLAWRTPIAIKDIAAALGITGCTSPGSIPPNSGIPSVVQKADKAANAAKAVAKAKAKAKAKANAKKKKK